MKFSVASYLNFKSSCVPPPEQKYELFFFACKLLVIDLFTTRRANCKQTRGCVKILTETHIPNTLHTNPKNAPKI